MFFPGDAAAGEEGSVEGASSRPQVAGPGGRAGRSEARCNARLAGYVELRAREFFHCPGRTVQAAGTVPTRQAPDQCRSDHLGFRSGLLKIWAGVPCLRSFLADLARDVARVPALSVGYLDST